MDHKSTIHTSRTMMFAELSRIMYHGVDHGSFESSLSENVAGKLTRSNQNKTNQLLKRLYCLDCSNPFFTSFMYFWKNGTESQYPVISLLFAIKNDYLLLESIDTVIQTTPGQKVSIESLETGIESQHPNYFAPTTLRSVAQNLASSWKQAGFIAGKVKNIRVQPEIDYRTITFALLIGYLEGLRGEYLLGSKYIRALGLPETKIRELISEAAKRDLLQYQHSGQVTTILFPTLLKTIGIYGE